MLISYADSPGSEQQWQAYFARLNGFQADEQRALRILAYTEGSPPRFALDRIMIFARGKTWRVALISPSTAVRFIASTFAFVIQTLRYFPATELSAALDHLDCDEGERRKVLHTLARLRGPVLELRS